MNTLRSIVALSCGIMLFAACKKEEATPATNNNTNTKTKRDFLIEGKWQIASVKPAVKTGIYDTNWNFQVAWDSCSKDNFAIYAADGTGYEDEGAIKCNPDKAQRSSFKWELLNDGTQLTIPSNKIVDTIEIQELTATKWSLKSISIKNSDTIPTIVTFRNIR